MHEAWVSTDVGCINSNSLLSTAIVRGNGASLSSPLGNSRPHTVYVPKAPQLNHFGYSILDKFSSLEGLSRQ